MLAKTTDKASNAVRALRREIAKLVAGLQGSVAQFATPQAVIAYS